MLETDLVAMMLLILLPIMSGAAILLMPDRVCGLARVVALFGSAAIVTLALCTIVSFYALLDSRLDRTGRPLHAPENRLDVRMDAIQSADIASPPRPRHHEDWVARRAWIERFDIWFSLGLDGISLSMILMTSVVVFVAAIAGWGSSTGNTLGLLLILEGGIHGCLLSMDLMLLYLFLQAAIVPVWLLVRGSERRPPVVLLASNALIFLAIVGLYSLDVRDFVDGNFVEAKIEDALKRQPGLTRERAVELAEIHTFDLVTLQRAGQAAFLIRTGQVERIAAMPTAEILRTRDRAAIPDPSKVELLGAGASPEAARNRYSQTFFTPAGQYLLFAVLLIGFGAMMGIFPLHSWIVGTLASVPTPVAMVVGGGLVQIGAYGLFRLVWPICAWPVDRASPGLCALALAGIAYGFVRAARETSLVRIVAFLSVGQMGYVLLGMSICTDSAAANYWSWGMNGAAFHLLAHGIGIASLLLVTGIVPDRFGETDPAKRDRRAATAAASGPGTLAFLGALGAPGLCGFIGIAFVVMGTWHYSPAAAIVSTASAVLSGYVVFRTMAKVRAAKEIDPTLAGSSGLDLREYAALSVLLLLSFALGLIPQMSILSWVEPSVAGLAENLSRLRP